MIVWLYIIEGSIPHNTLFQDDISIRNANPADDIELAGVNVYPL
jgi:hypothetical protein